MGGRLVVAYGAVLAHDLLRREAALFHGVAEDRVVLAHECARCGSDEHGRPRLLPTASLRDPAHVSIARTGELSVVALTDVGGVGVDVEPAGAARFDGFDEVALHPAERVGADGDPTRVWVRKEALLKAYGLGLAVDPSTVLVDDDGLAGWDTDHPRPTAVLVRDVDVPGYVVSVVVLPAHAATDLAVELHRR